MFKPFLEHLEDRTTPTLLTTPQQIFVDSAYQSLLARPAGDNDLAFWTGRLSQGASRQEVVLEIEQSTEYRQNVVFDTYQLMLARAPEPAGYAFWVPFLQNNTIEQFKAMVAASPEYFSVRGGSTNQGFVKAVYTDLLNRDIDPSSSVFLTALQAGATRQQVAQVIATSAEANGQVVDDLYTKYLNHFPSAADRQLWVKVLQQGVPEQNMVAEIIGSAEHQRLE